MTYQKIYSMRYLNKIIFINSASIAYAEIGLSGNVHFIGTQGVGKSTCLRAILFFYNADKIKLGIEKSKRTFDDYYLPHANSYIIYEVLTENGPFCVLLFKSQGRAAFRFINSAYHKENYIGHDHRAMIWDQLRNTFPTHTSYSRKVDRYEEYRDIIYGNNKGLDAVFRKYALIESRSYQNLPRTIQNVFLNSKLEAEFIKQTIIMSLNEEDIRIDLDQYALHLKNFEQQLNDIGKWSEQNRSGEVVVRILASNIAKLRRTVNFLTKEKHELFQNLIAIHHQVEQAHPFLLKELVQLQGKHAQAEKRVREANDKFQERVNKINKEITLMDDRLSEAKNKNDLYLRLDINSIIDRVSKKAVWETKKHSMEAERHLLSFRYQEITDKYKALLQQLHNQLEKFINDREKENNTLNAEVNKRKDKIKDQFEKILKEMDMELAVLKENADMKEASIQENIHQITLETAVAKVKRWYEDELNEVEQVIKHADQELLAIKNFRTNSRAQIESLQKSWAMDEKEVQMSYAAQKVQLDQRIAAEKSIIAENESIISRSSHSFYEWLHNNKPGWEENIGKVINQQSILFNSELSPKSVDANGHLLYGVELNLAQLPLRIKTIADYEQEIKTCYAEIAKHQASITNLAEQESKEIDKISRKYQPQIKQLKEEIGLGEYNETKFIQKQKQAILSQEEWKRKAESKKSQVLDELNKRKFEAEQEKVQAQGEWKATKTNKTRQQEERKRELKSKLQEEDQRLANLLKQSDESIAAEKQQVALRRIKIEENQNKDLHQEGAEVERLKEIDTEILQIETELNYIEANRDRVAEYNKDKRELFDLVDEFKAKRKIAMGKLATEKGGHAIAKSKLQESLSVFQNQISSLELKLRETMEDLTAFEEFCKSDLYLSLANDEPNIIKVEAEPIRLVKIIATIYEKISESNNRMTELRSHINRFLSNFSVGNIFGFETILVDDQQYLHFADNLSEFLEENKIDEYERRTNELFASLILQVGRETTELVSKEAIINKVINDINRDFMERNFAGVIKGIELRMTPSASKIVSLLQHIRLFNDEYAIALGTANLFSQEDSTLNNKKAVNYLRSFALEIAASKQNEVTLSDTFELQFKIVENDNDSGWVEKLTNVGSEGTDVLVKAMINIMLLNVFKENASKKFKDFRLHCMMDEIGKLHPNNVKGILKFANDRNIVLINSSPTSYNAIDYKHTYLLSKDKTHATLVKRLITNNQVYEN